jgi:hypothetical protein
MSTDTTPTRLHALLREITRNHFPNPPAMREQVDALELRVGWKLDAETRAFYLHCDGAELFTSPDSPYRILPLEEITRVRLAMFAGDDDEFGSPLLYALCYVQDGNYVAVDTSGAAASSRPLRDCFHERIATPENCPIIASSFSQFLEQALASGGKLYWLQKGWALPSL